MKRFKKGDLVVVAPCDFYKKPMLSDNILVVEILRIVEGFAMCRNQGVECTYIELKYLEQL